MSTERLKFHPIAQCFPLMDTDSDEFRLLVEDIRENGQREVIALFENQILDGRNRYNACLEADQEPRTYLWEGDDPVGFVISANLRRNHLTASQRGIAAGKLANLRQGGDAGQPDSQDESNSARAPLVLVSQSQAAEAMGVSTDTVKRAKKVLDSGDTQLADDVASGKVSVKEGARRVDQAKAKPSPPAHPTDKLGHEITNKEVIAAFVQTERLSILIGDIRAISRDLPSLRECPAAAYLHFLRIETDLKNAVIELKGAKPYALCPYCRSKGNKGCKECHNAGWMTKDRYQNVPAEVIEKAGQKKGKTR